MNSTEVYVVENGVPRSVENTPPYGLDVEMVGGVACPVDPMEALQCDSCQ